MKFLKAGTVLFLKVIWIFVKLFAELLMAFYKSTPTGDLFKIKTSYKIHSDSLNTKKIHSNSLNSKNMFDV